MSNKSPYRLNDDGIQAIKEIQRRLRVTSPGIAGPDDPLSFDPESDAMQPAEAKIKESRIARTVVHKLKTSQFKILTRSHTFSTPPSSYEELTAIALMLRERVDLGPKQRFRLVGVGLSNFGEPGDTAAQPDLFE
jgi:nucleotidyltransferase/DNA polymerase involved in DNA repair